MNRHQLTVLVVGLVLQVQAGFPEAVADSDLEPGFPAKTFSSGGRYQGGPGNHTLVGNIDADPQLEIVVTGLSTGPLYAFKSDGTLATGWPLWNPYGAAYAALGELSVATPGLEIFSGHWSEAMGAYDGSGNLLPGNWPRPPINYMSTPATLVDINGDGVDEIFVNEEDGRIHGYKADGYGVPGWPSIRAISGQRLTTPAAADIDGDGDPELITADSGSTLGTYLYAYHHDATPVAGFPVELQAGYVMTFPSIGDVDRDGQLDIVVVTMDPASPARPALQILSNAGIVKRIVPLAGSIAYGTQAVLADLDGDNSPEIVVQAEGAVNVVKGDGASMPGWPLAVDGRMMHPAPVIGDVDGDKQPDVVFVVGSTGSGSVGDLHVVNRIGRYHPRFPKRSLLIEHPVTPAIADIDLDGRNEIIVTGNYFVGYAGEFDKVWAYDLGNDAHGPIQWGQFAGGPSHQSRYRPVAALGSAADLRLAVTTGAESLVLGDELTYSLLITNHGPEVATNVVVADQLPPAAAAQLLSVSTGCSLADRTVSCPLGTLDVGSSARVDVVVRPLAAGTLVNRASALSNERDLNLYDNLVETSTAVRLPASDLAVTVASAPDPAHSRRDLTYTLNAINSGPERAANVTVSLQLGYSPSYVSVPSGCNAYGDTVNCMVGLLGAGATRGLSIVVIPNSIGRFVGTTRIRGDVVDANKANDVFYVSTDIKR